MSDEGGGAVRAGEYEEAGPDLGAGAAAAPQGSEGLAVVEGGSDGLELVEPETAAGGLEAVEDGEEVEYEYVYEDEDGNVIEAPESELDSGHYEEVIEVVEDGAEHRQVTDPAAPTVNIPPEKRPTRRIRSGSTRRRSGRQSGRLSTRQLDPAAAMKHARIKTLLLLGSIALIPILIVAILVTAWFKFWKPRPPTPVVVMNDYHKGLAVYRQAMASKRAADRHYRNNDDARSYPLYRRAKREFEKSQNMMQGWRDQNPGEGYYYVDNHIMQIAPLLKDVNEKLFMIEMRGGNKGGG